MKKLELLLAKQGSDKPEVFASLQGEGPFTGRPSVFVRVSGCNLTCYWCDTPYTWNWHGAGFAHEGEVTYDRQLETRRVNVADVVELVSRYDCRNVVLTGGEPLAQAKVLHSLMMRLRAFSEDYRFDVETNGTIAPSPEFDAMIALYVVSPKFSNSGVSPERAIRAQALSFYSLSTRAVFKFVVGNEEDLEEVVQFVQRLDLAPERVYLMPRALSAAELRKNQQFVARQCMHLGFRFSDRLHLRLYGSRRGT